MVVGSSISIKRLSIYFKFLRASEVAIIYASVEDEEPTICSPLLQPKSDFTILSIEPVWLFPS